MNFHLFIYLDSIAVSLPLTLVLAIPSATPSQSLPLYFLLLWPLEEITAVST